MLVAIGGVGLRGSALASELEPADPELPEPPRALSPSPPDLDVSGEDAQQEEGIPGRYIVVLEDGVQQPGEVAREQAEERGGDLGVLYRITFKGYVMDNLSHADVAALRQDPRVHYVEQDRKIHLAAQTIPFGVSRVFAPQNEALDIDGVDDARVNADVAVIDSRIDPSHPDLHLAQRINCVPSNPEAEPECVADTGSTGSWHGTHVAGMIGAIDNSFGVVGVAPGVRLWGVRVFNDQGEGRTSWTNTAIEWVAAHAAEIEVANMSLGGAGSSPSQDKAIADAAALGIVSVVAGGNQSENTLNRHPANSADAVTVSALADYDGKSGGSGSTTCVDQGADDTSGIFSNWGSAIELTAPGVCIYSTDVGGGYSNAKWGTSFATPHVAGAAALLASKSNPQSKADVEALRQQLIDGGSLDWTDTSADGKPEPLLYLGNTPLTQVEAATGGWSGDNGTSVTLHGAVNTRGAAGEYRFEYGSTTAYGKSAPATPGSLSAGTKYQPVSQVVGGLEPGQTLHYRLSVTTSGGTAYGKDRVLTTPRLLQRVPSSKPEAQYDWLNDVSCPSAGFCLATGYYRTPNNNNIGVYKLSNGQWSFTQLPQPEGSSYPQAFGVSCSSSSACTAVGRVKVNGRLVPLAERWNGTSWSLQSVPLPYAMGSSTVLRDVSCVSATECMAVGTYKNAEGKFVNYAAQWKGSAWSSTSPPNLSGSTQSLLEDVSCATSSYCTAVGWTNTGGSGSKRVIVTWNGSSWSLGTPAVEKGGLYGVDCTSSTFCVAVGGQFAMETWDGSKWTSHPALKPDGSNGGYLEGVSCTSPDYCMAVGAVWMGPHRFALAEVWDGDSWELEPALRKAEEESYFGSVGCVSLSACVGIGGASTTEWKSVIAEREDVITNPPADVLPGQAVLRGAISPGSLPTTYKFEFGETTGYGSSIPVSESSAGSGAAPVDLSKVVGELEPETTYHYRLSATSEAGTAYGKDMVFRSGTPQHHLVRSFGSSGSGKGQVDAPWGLDVDLEGNLWVADRNNHRIEKYSPSGQFLLMAGGGVNKTTLGNVCTAASNHECGIGAAGSASGQFREPLDVAVTASGDLWVTDGGNDRVQKFNSQGEYLGQFGSSGTGNGQFSEPWGIDIASNGDIWVVDATYYRVQEFTSGGSFIQKVTGLEGPRGLEVDEEDHVWVTERTANRVQELGPAGEKLTQFGVPGTGPGQFDEPQAIDLKSSGDLLVTDRFNDRVQQFSSSGAFVSQFGNNQVIEPRGVTDASEGRVYVSNSWKDRIDEWQQNTPRAVTGNVAEVTSSGGTLAGTVNPHGVATEYRFEYGKTSAYGTKVSNAAAGSGTSDLAVSKAIGGLQPNTTYHYRVVATSVEGTVYGEDRTFTTSMAIGSGLDSMAVTEPFNGSTESLANFGSKWAALGWAGGSTPKGSDTTTGWRPVDAYPAVNGASYNPSLTQSGLGIAAVATMAANPGSASRYLSLWLDMPTPTGTKAGYELRFTNTASNTYTVTLSKWSGGAQTVLATQTGYAFGNGSSLALVDQGSTVSAWTNTGAGFNQLLSAADSAFNGGNAGVEGSGYFTRLTNFKAGTL